MKLIGKATINPIFFITGKTAGYTVYILLLLEAFKIITIKIHTLYILQLIAYLLGAISFIIMIISFFNLGSSTRLGIPSESTKLKTHGLYKFSRNPMYLSFHLLTLSVMLYTGHPIVIALGLYSFVIYDFIIKGEEAFLEKRFGQAFINYKKQVQRYI